MRNQFRDDARIHVHARGTAPGPVAERERYQGENLKPYYSHAGITIFHGDCREILPSLEPDSVDLIVTDPPYGVRWMSTRGSTLFGGITGDESTDAALTSLPLALKVLKRKRHVYMFGRYDMSGIAGIGVQAELIWDKCQMGLGDLNSPFGPQHEYIQFFSNVRLGDESKGKFGEGVGAARLRKGSVLSFPRINGRAVTVHPTEKPAALIRELIESSSRIGETVLDYFSGAGSTLVASRLEGRKAIGIEIEERYCEIAAKRLSQEVFDLGEVTA
jgi:DNA modification methylase